MAESYGRFASIYDALMREVDYDGWAAYLASFLPGENLAIAECACGTGEIAIRLARQGYRVTGADLSVDMLRVAMEKAHKDGLQIPFIHQDMRRLRLHQPVDAILCACDGLNYLERDGLDEFFAAAHDNLKPGGLLLADVSSRYKLETILACNTFAEDDGETAYIWRNVYDPDSRHIRMDLSFFRKVGPGLFERFEEMHIQRAHSEKEVRNALRTAGFEAEAYDAFTRAAVRQDSERIQFVGKRA